MDKKLMQQIIKEALSKKLGADFQISIKEILKTNQKRDGLSIRSGSKTSTVVPVLYLEPYYKDLERNMPLEDVINDILDDYFGAVNYSENYDLSSVFDFDWAKDRLYVRIINRHLNEEMLKNVPHSLFLDDFAVTVHCFVGTEAQEEASLMITDKFLKLWNVRSDALISYAIQNTRKIAGVELMNMHDFLRRLDPDGFFGVTSSIPIWILTNRQKQFGAASILFDDVLKDFAKDFGSFYTVFSSVHEVLLLPAENDSDLDTISFMNRSVNETEVAENEILGTKAYYYSMDKGFVL